MINIYHFIFIIHILVSSVILWVSSLQISQASKDPMVVEKIMTDLDENRDGEVDFQEFVVLVAALTVACNEFFIESMKKWIILDSVCTLPSISKH